MEMADQEIGGHISEQQIQKQWVTNPQGVGNANAREIFQKNFPPEMLASLGKDDTFMLFNWIMCNSYGHVQVLTFYSQMVNIFVKVSNMLCPGYGSLIFMQ